MIADLSTYSPWILLVGFIVILLLGLVLGFAKGFIKIIFGIILYIVYAIVAFLLATPVATWLSGYGFIENWMNNSGFTSTDVYTLIQGFVPDLAATCYKVIAVVGLLILGFIVVGILSHLLAKFVNKFKLTKKLNRILGTIFGGLVSCVVLTAMLTVISCELLFSGGSTWIKATPVVDGFNDVTSQVRVTLLCNKGIPCDVETLLARSLGGSDMSAEEISQYADTFRRVDEITSDPTAYLSQAVNEDGSINNEGLSVVLSDAAVLSALSTKYDVGGSISGISSEMIDSALNEIPADTDLGLSSKDVENLETIKSNLDLTPEQISKIDSIIASNSGS